MKKYVWYKGRTWIDTGLIDHMGRHELISWVDTSDGVVAPPDKIKPCLKRDIEGIEYFRPGLKSGKTNMARVEFMKNLIEEARKL